MWRGCQDNLPTRTKLARKGLIQGVECVFYRGNSETVEHVLRDCDFAAAVWLVGLGLRIREAPLTSFRAWILDAAQNMSKQAFELSLMLESSIWAARNALFWHGKLPLPRWIN